ncbi:hypothetical protein [Albibacillus kandeliae]|uniref:hypothetical protein n=1 Tax=Albibacillus kandeliae TaxID=2174228 RepID=UPI000D697724|nr:hypothetical protein [Albibacillus kandeliae]
MATKKTAAVAGDGTKAIVAFMLKDHSEGDGPDAVVFTAGQRLELGPEEFEAMAEAGLCAEGVFAKMLSAVEGGRYSLRPHQKIWLAPAVYEGWKAAGICEATSDDPDVSATLAAREAAMQEAVAERDAIARSAESLRVALHDMDLTVATARAQVEKLLGMVGAVQGDEGEALAEEVRVLLDILPDVPADDAGDSGEPQLNL